MQSSENCAHKFGLRYYHLRYFIHYVLVSFEIGTGNIKTLTKQFFFFFQKIYGMVF